MEEMTEKRRKQLDAYINQTDEAVVEYTIRERHYETQKFDPDIAGSYYYRDMAFLLKKLDEARAEIAALKKQLESSAVGGLGNTKQEVSS